MSSSTMQNEWAKSYLSGGNMAYIDGLYEDYLADPSSISEEWQEVFAALPQVNGQVSEISHRNIRDYLLQNVDKRTPQVVVSDENKLKLLI